MKKHSLKQMVLIIVAIVKSFQRNHYQKEKVVEKKKLLYDTNEKPPIGKWIMLSLQHVFAMFGATVTVPLLTGLSISVTLFCAGIATLWFHFITKGKIPVFLGSSFAFLEA